MPEEHYTWLPSEDILSFEEISVLVDRFMALGVSKVRLTGGEPLLRRELPVLISMLARKGLQEIALTTNGVLLASCAEALHAAGLNRLTISLDTLRRDRFLSLTRRDQLSHVLRGIEAAHAAGFTSLKFDTVLVRGRNDDEVEELFEFANQHQAEIRFIEYMDVGGATQWSMDQVVPSSEVLLRLKARYGAIEPLPHRGSAPGQRFALSDARTFGLISSTTQPFCQTCDRARLTADGEWLTCLYAEQGLDLKAPLRSGASASEIETLIATKWQNRSDAGAEQRLKLREKRGPLASAEQLRVQPHREMHTRGG